MKKSNKGLIRRAHICDAAIGVLGSQGAAGFSHHKVDDTAEIARGSTSYYYRTKLALVLATMDRIEELDANDISQFLGQDELAMSQSAEFLHNWLKGEGLIRTRARLEIFMLAASEPAICDRVRLGRQAIKTLVDNMTQKFFQTIHPETRNRLIDMAMMGIDGLMFINVRERNEPPSVEEISFIFDFWIKQFSIAND